MEDPFDTSRAGAKWTDRDGKRYIEVRRLNDGRGHLYEVQLSPAGMPALRGWYSAAELVERGLIKVPQ